VNKSKAGALFAASGNGMASVASNSQAPSVSSASALDVSAFSGPPDTFFVPPDANGYATVEGFYANQTVKVRYIMKSGSTVDPTFLGTKSLAKLGTFEWDSMFTGGEPSSQNVIDFANAPTYEALSTIADYMNWAWTAGLVEDGVRQNPTVDTLLGSNHFANPSPEATEQVSSMEGVVTMANDATGTLNMIIAVKSADEYGMPTGATGSGTIEVGSITLDATMEVTFTATGANDALSLTGTTDDNNTVTVNAIADGSGTGTIKDSGGTTVATMEISATGQVTVYDSDGHQSTYQL
jgi:hypothetical protein